MTIGCEKRVQNVRKLMWIIIESSRKIESLNWVLLSFIFCVERISFDGLDLFFSFILSSFRHWVLGIGYNLLFKKKMHCLLNYFG